MRSKIKASLFAYHLFIILLVGGLSGGMLYDLGANIPLWSKIILIIILICYPPFVIYSYLKIPIIWVKENKIIEQSFQEKKEINFDDILEITPSKFLNKIYKIGIYYSIQSKDDLVINIPLKVYKNEMELLQQIETKYKIYKSII